MDVVVVGSASADFICSVADFPKPGQTIKSASPHLQCWGGKGANQAVQAARLGSKVGMIGMLGNDSAGKEYREALEKEGIDTKGMGTTHDVPTGIALIWVNNKGQNCIVISPGANNAVSVHHVEEYVDSLTDAKVILFQLEIPIEASMHAIKKVRERCTTQNKVHPIIVFNTAPAPENGSQGLPSDIFALVDILCPNETEAALLTEVPKLETDAEIHQCALKLLEKGPRFVILTLGEKGALYSDLESKMHFVPAETVASVVDTSGAGDSFLGALASYVAQSIASTPTEETRVKALNACLRSAITHANHVAAKSVQKKGTQPSFPTIGEL
eukprot:ANDGO_02256.mRNA.1 Ribokinase